MATLSPSTCIETSTNFSELVVRPDLINEVSTSTHISFYIPVTRTFSTLSVKSCLGQVLIIVSSSLICKGKAIHGIYMEVIYYMKTATDNKYHKFPKLTLGCPCPCSLRIWTWPLLHQVLLSMTPGVLPQHCPVLLYLHQPSLSW